MTFTYPSHTTKGCVPLSSDVNIIGTEQLQVIAEDIVSHSKFDDELLLEEDYVPTVMWELAKYCCFSCFS